MKKKERTELKHVYINFVNSKVRDIGNLCHVYGENYLTVLEADGSETCYPLRRITEIRRVR